MNERLRRTLLVAMGAVLLFHLVFHASPLTGLFPLLPIELGMWLLSAFAVINALLLIGPTRTLTFFLLAASIGFLAEQTGVSTGWVFGKYEYTEVLKPPTLGDVPLVIVCCWFMIVYLSHVVTNLMIAGRPLLKTSGYHRLLLAFVTAMVATAYDVAMDPTMASPSVRAWIWTDGGDYLGVPFRNFGGWMGTSFAIAYLYRSIEFRTATPADRKPEPLLATSVVVSYGALGLFWVLLGDPPATQIIAAYVMGIPTIVAAVNLVRWVTKQDRDATT